MVTAHTKSTSDLEAAITASALTLPLPLPLPAILPPELIDRIDALGNVQASDFDKLYITQQVNAHQSALDVTQRYANDGDTPAIKAFAGGLAPMVQSHLAKARSFQARTKTVPATPPK